MKPAPDLAESLALWAGQEASVKGLILFGSRVRGTQDKVWQADENSDWDFHIITSRPRMFLDSAWLQAATGKKISAYAVRTPRVGGMPKINVVLGDQEADLVILPAHVMRAAKWAMAFGLHHRSKRFRRSMQDLAIVMRPGWRFLKGASAWGHFYTKVVAEVDDPRLDDIAARNLADAFVCDYRWAQRKLARGEFLAVQRIIHRELAETNLQLMHECRLRRGLRSFPDARRFELVASPEERRNFNVSSSMEPKSLMSALDQHAATFRSLISELLGNSWSWPLE